MGGVIMSLSVALAANVTLAEQRPGVFACVMVAGQVITGLGSKRRTS